MKTYKGTPLCYTLVDSGAIAKHKGTPLAIARIRVRHTYTSEELAEELKQRCLSLNIPSAMIRYILDSIAELIPTLLQQGNAVNLNDLVTFRPTLRGTFEPNERFNPAKHTLTVSAVIGKDLRDVLAGSPVKAIR